MNQSERRHYLIEYLKKEDRQYSHMTVPSRAEEQKMLLRGLMNIREPKEISPEFLKIQDEYLQEEIRKKGIVTLDELTPLQEGIYLWQGDITRLAADAIVNAANSGMTGCYQPNHSCIDNCIHTFGGVQMRLECEKLMEEQGYPEPTGRAKITKGYNLPAQYVLHTVGPIIRGAVTKQEEELLTSCYRSCLELAEEKNLESVVFCCISNGVFCFPNERAAEIAVETVKDYQKHAKKKMEVVFNVFQEKDYDIYRRLLGAD